MPLSCLFASHETKTALHLRLSLQRKWMHELQQEVAAAVDMQDDAVSIIYKLLAPALEQLPVKDEDIHYILFFQKQDALALQGAEAEAAEAEKHGFGAESLGDAALTAAYAEDMTPIAEWLHSLGIRKYEEYARMMEVMQTPSPLPSPWPLAPSP